MLLDVYFNACLRYNNSTKGRHAMTQYEQLDLLLVKSKGMIQTAQLRDLEITKTVFYRYVKDRDLEQVAHGIYASKDAWMDSMYLLHLRFGQIVFSHDTALLFHDLTDREPIEYSVTVKAGYNTSKLRSDGVKVYTVKSELVDLGLTVAQTPFDHTVPVYDMERTICDLVRSRNGIEIQVLQGAMKQYTRRKEKNLRKLMQYAAAFRVEKILRQYLEVLL